MIRAALALLAASLGGCAMYSITPFYDAGAQKVICCRAYAWSAKDAATVNFFATETNGIYVIHFVETGVNASTPIAAAAIAASDVAGAVTASALAAAKFAP